MAESIIIDGVDVNKCEFYIPETQPNEDEDEFLDVCNFPNSYNSFCYENKDCWYKQLQRAKEELKQYKKSKIGVLTLTYIINYDIIILIIQLSEVDHGQ